MGAGFDVGVRHGLCHDPHMLSADTPRPRDFRRRRFLSTTASAVGVAAVAPRLLGADPGRDAFEFGVVADPQYADIAPAGTRHYRASLGKLREALEHFRPLDLEFCVNLGDAVDRAWSSYDAVLGVFGTSRHRFRHVLGNHDFELPDEFKARVAGRLGLEARYYSWDRPGWRFVVLDTNDVSTYAHATGSSERVAAERELKRLEAAKVRQAQSWNGGVGEAQLRWFEEACRTAAQTGRRVVVFAHHPIHPADVHDAWNAERLLEVVHGHRNVVAWFNGHQHGGAFAEYDGVPCLTFKGMVETPDTNAFAVVRVDGDRLSIRGHGREISRELRVRPA